MDYAKLKDESPAKTVEKIKKILNDCNISVQEGDWIKINNSNPDEQPVYAIRVEVCEGIGANGKGTDKEYALASAYGEFIERLQNGFPVDLNYKMKDECYVPQEEFLKNREDLVDEKFFRCAYQKHLLEDINYEKPLSEIISYLQYLLTGDKNSDVYCVKFYDVKNNKTVLFPEKIKKAYNTTNGMASGNTPEEALVQGFSEVIERYVTTKILANKLVCPIIPEKFYIKYNSIKKMIDFYKNSGVSVQVRDASLGEGFPAICIIFIDVKSHKYTVKFASHPVFAIAVERCLTEFAQGLCILPFFDMTEPLSIINNNIKEKMNMYTTCAFSYGEGFFINKPNWEFSNKIWSEPETTNKEMLQKIKDLILSKNYNIYIRNVSFLGFPSFHIFIPEMSNYVFNSLRLTEDLRHKIYELQNKNGIKVSPGQTEDCLISGFDSFELGIALSDKDYEKALNDLEIINKAYPAVNTKDSDLRKCLKDYCILKIKQYTNKDINNLLTEFYGTELVNDFKKEFLSKDLYLLNLFKMCFNMVTNGENYILYKNITAKLSEIISQKTLNTDIEQIEIQNII